MGLAGRLQDIFGRENLLVELQDHGLDAQRRTNPSLMRIARALGAPLIATNDSHYCRREDAVAHDALLVRADGCHDHDPKRFKFEGQEHYLKSAAEMRHLFAEVPDACDNTLLDRREVPGRARARKARLPQFPVPEAFRRDTYEQSAAGYLRHLTYEGAAARYGQQIPPEVSRAARFRAPRI